jgi:hypothetical protein
MLKTLRQKKSLRQSSFSALTAAHSRCLSSSHARDHRAFVDTGAFVPLLSAPEPSSMPNTMKVSTTGESLVVPNNGTKSRCIRDIGRHWTLGPIRNSTVGLLREPRRIARHFNIRGGVNFRNCVFARIRDVDEVRLRGRGRREEYGQQAGRRETS